MRHSTKSIIAGVSLAIITSIAPAGADENLNCGAYASAAVAQYNHSKSMGCGFSGGRWSADYNGHRNWCLSKGVGIMDVSNENHLREKALQQCGANVSMCDAYAQNAVAAHAANIKNGCGFSGGRWSTNYAGHKNWCMGAGETLANQEQLVRSMHMQQCLSN